MLRGDGKVVVASLKTKAQEIVTGLLPDKVKAAVHGRTAEPSGRRHLHAADVNTHLGGISGGARTAKDFRTWHTTRPGGRRAGVCTGAPRNRGRTWPSSDPSRPVARRSSG
jgi:hypothetical protein